MKQVVTLHSGLQSKIDEVNAKLETLLIQDASGMTLEQAGGLSARINLARSALMPDTTFDQTTTIKTKDRS